MPVTILVVDDDSSIRMLMTRILLRDGYGVGEATNGEEALEKLRTGSYGVMILDLMMPVLSGFEVLRYLAEHDDAGAPKVIVSSAANTPSIESVRASRNVHTVIRKPFDLDLLREAVRTCVAEAALPLSQ
ncbi:MAG TPA: response regulator [Thermoanaerobaculia bacterium]